MKKVARICRRCEATFAIFQCHLRRQGNGTFCSRVCKDAAARHVVAGSNAGIIAAHAAGYRAGQDGRVHHPDGSDCKLVKHRRTGYWYFAARGCSSPLSLHRFIAFQLFGEEALSAACVRHLNDDRDDNSFANIAFGTHSQNQFDIPQGKRSQMGVKRNAWKRQFEPEQVREIRRLLADGWSLSRLRGLYGGSLGAFANIRDGRTYREVTA